MNDKLKNYLKYFSMNHASNPNFPIAYQVLNGLAYILDNMSALKKKVANKNLKSIYANDRDFKNKVLRAPGGLSFHIGYFEPDDFCKNYEIYIQSLLDGLDKISMYHNSKELLDKFIGKVDDSPIGCMEARMSPAMDFIHNFLINETPVFNDIMEDFFKLNEYFKNVDSDGVYQQSLLYFQDKIGTDISYNNKIVSLNWKLIFNYLEIEMGFDKINPQDFMNKMLNHHAIISERAQRKDVYVYFDTLESAQQARVLLEYCSCSKNVMADICYADDSASHAFLLRVPKQVWAMRMFNPENYEASDEIGGRYFMKTVSTKNIPDFVQGISRSPMQNTIQNLRPNKKLAYTVYADKAVPRKNKQPMYSQEQKLGFSPIQSITLINSKTTTKPYKNDTPGLIGVLMHKNSVLMNRLLRNNGFTYLRPFDAQTSKEAKLKHQNYINKNLLYSPSEFNKFLQAIENKTNHNEVLARLRWNIDTDKVGIFYDDLESRLTAVLLAEQLTFRMRERNAEMGLSALPKDFSVPILFYTPGNIKHLKYYSKEMYQEDKKLAIKCFENLDDRHNHYANNFYGFLLALDEPDNALIENYDNRSILFRMLASKQFWLAAALMNKCKNPQKIINTLPEGINLIQYVSGLIRINDYNLASKLIERSGLDKWRLKTENKMLWQFAVDTQNIAMIDFFGYKNILFKLADTKLSQISKFLKHPAFADRHVQNASLYGELLYRAVYGNESKLVKKLFSLGADISQMHWDISIDNVEILGLLFSNGVSSGVLKPLWTVCNCAQMLTFMRKLPEKNRIAFLLSKNMNGENGLQMLPVQMRLEAFQLLPQELVSKTIVDLETNGQPVLESFMGTAHWGTLINFLNESGAMEDLKKHPEILSRLLFKAVRKNSVSDVQNLLEWGADKAVIHEQQTVMELAVINRSTAILKLLLKNYVPQQDDELFKKAYQAALLGFNEEPGYIPLFLEVYPDLCNVQHRYGHSALMLAVYDMNLYLVKLLLKYPVDLNYAVNIGNGVAENPLHIACRTGNIDIVKCLIKAGADFGGKLPNLTDATLELRSLCLPVIPENQRLTVLTTTSNHIKPLHSDASYPQYLFNDLQSLPERARATALLSKDSSGKNLWDIISSYRDKSMQQGIIKLLPPDTQFIFNEITRLHQNRQSFFSIRNAKKIGLIQNQLEQALIENPDDVTQHAGLREALGFRRGIGFRRITSLQHLAEYENNEPVI